MTRTSRVVAAAFTALASLSTLSSLFTLAACSGRTPPARSAPTAHARPEPQRHFESNVPDRAPAEAHAQQAWCSYLEELYKRATKDGTPWAELDRCKAHVSTAAPEMLERTAVCSHKALEEFPGDPFTDAYAAEVKRCGTTVIEAMALTPAEVEPYVALICERGPECGQVDADECRSDVMSRLGHKIARSVGTLSSESRLAFRQCLLATSCQDADDRIAHCLEPILERLLWTPG